MQASDGMNYSPEGTPRPVVGPGEFAFAATALEHGHIYGMCNGLTEAGALLKWVYDPDPAKVERFTKTYPGVRVARSEDEILQDPAVRLVAAAAIPSDRCALGLRVMDHGKDYFTDKAPMTTLDQLAQARRAVQRTGRKYAVYYSERIHVESAIYAGRLVEQGAIGRVVQVLNLAPHRLSAPSRPAWFFQKARTGGILCDIGSHQIEQFLHYSRATDASVLCARVANCNTPQHPEFEDYGDATLVSSNGATQYLRVDWLNPAGLRSWGDGRLFILGTEGYIEVRKYVEVAREEDGGQVYMVNGEREQRFAVRGKVGFPYFGQFILDCLNRTEDAMTQAHAFLAAELCLKAQDMADRARQTAPSPQR